MTTEQIKETILAKISEQQAIIDAGSITVDEAKAETAKFLDALKSEDVELLRSTSDMPDDAAAISNAARSIDLLRVSLAQDLIHVHTQYVVTDGDLISPSGFHVDDKVFVRNDVFIQTDSLPRCTSRNLRAHKV